MPLITSLAYPNATILVMDGLDASVRTEIALADVRPGVPANFDYGRKLIVVRRVGGGPDDDDLTDYPVVQVQCYAPSYLAAAAMQDACQVEILSWPMQEIGPNKILVDGTYRLGLRRQFRP
jgi:hypothetical protein